MNEVDYVYAIPNHLGEFEFWIFFIFILIFGILD